MGLLFSFRTTWIALATPSESAQKIKMADAESDFFTGDDLDFIFGDEGILENEVPIDQEIENVIGTVNFFTFIS